MTIKNRYYKRARIAEKNFRRIIRYFSLDISATNTAKLSGISVRSINSIYIKIRYRLAEECENYAQNDNAGRRSVAKQNPNPPKHKNSTAYTIFGLFSENGRIYAEIVPESIKCSLQSVIRGKMSIDGVIDSNDWHGYHGLLDMGYWKYYRVESNHRGLINKTPTINGTESFWAYAKHRLSKMKGIRKGMLYYHIKESEFRFNHRHDDIYLLVLKLLREKPI
ncbi:MAG: IS1595 family transposase [Candidatus Thiodiazotropha sp.]